MQRRKLIGALVVAATVLTGAAGTNETAKSSRPSVEELEALRARNLERAGGMVVKPGSQAGKVAVLDTQAKVAREAFTNGIEELKYVTKMNFVYEKTAPGAPEELLKRCQANFAVILVDEPESPAVLIALEDRWAKVNVAKMDRGLKTEAAREKFLASRCSKEAFRVLAILCGGSASQFPGNVMDVSSLEDLDLAVPGLPIDRIDGMLRYLPKNGVTPEIRATYRKACRLGWAPPPTNEFQKIAWDRAHNAKEQGPANALKIRPPRK